LEQSVQPAKRVDVVQVELVLAIRLGERFGRADAEDALALADLLSEGEDEQHAQRQQRQAAEGRPPAISTDATPCQEADAACGEQRHGAEELDWVLFPDQPRKRRIAEEEREIHHRYEGD